MAEVKSPAKILEELRAEAHTLDSKISLIAQKIKTMEQNQEVIGRTIVSQNEKIRALEETGIGAPKEASGGAGSEGLEKRVVELEKQAKEIKYLLENINPLEYATVEQVKELIEGKLKK